MSRRLVLAALTLAFPVLIPIAARAAVPSTFTYQGSLKQNGAVVNSTQTIEIRLTNVDGTQVYWTSGAQLVNVTEGLYRMELSPTGLDLSTTTPYIETKVNGTLLLPREKMTSGVYALVAKDLAASATAKGDLQVIGSLTAKNEIVLSSGAAIYPAISGSVNLGKSTTTFGRLFLSSGTRTVPAITLAGDDNTGIYQYSGDGTLAITSNGVDRVRIFSTIALGNQFMGTFQVDSGNLIPNSAGAQNLGTSIDYWGTINYKTLTDRGCLGWFDEGVLMPDGKTYSDLNAISLIRKSSTKKTVYGAAMLDYKSFPAVAYQKASYQIGVGTAAETRLWPRDTNDEPYDPSGLKKPQDGVEMTSVFSIMIGAFKEANQRIKDLEAQVATLTATVQNLQSR